MSEPNNQAAGVIICLDVGNARIGVAASDELQIAVSPLMTIKRGGGRELAEIVDLIRNRKATEVVIGVPYELDGSSGDQAKVSTSFKAQLEKRLLSQGIDGIRVETWDERFTSREAERVLAGSKLKNKDRSAATDRIAAAIILNSYLERNRNQTGG
jgi:putative Holliday junction resolvase